VGDLDGQLNLIGPHEVDALVGVDEDRGGANDGHSVVRLSG